MHRRDTAANLQMPKPGTVWLNRETIYPSRVYILVTQRTDAAQYIR